MEKINFQDGVTKGNAETFNRMQSNIETAINETNEKDVYSAEERVVGTWFGKPLYRKVFTSFDINYIPQEWTKLVSLSGLNVSTIAHSTLTCMGSSTNNVPIEQHLYLLDAANNNNDLKIWGPNHFGNIHTLILEYTKTTD